MYKTSNNSLNFESMESGQKKWQRFEALVAKVQQDLAPLAQVIPNYKIQGVSGRVRQIDVMVKHAIGQYEMLIAIDCKDYKRPIDVKDVESFIAMLGDIKVHQGVLVGANGFTSTALQRALNAGVKLYRLVDAEQHDWQAKVSVPVVCDFRGVKNFQLIFEDFDEIPLGTPPQKLELYNAKGESLGTIMKILHKKWQQGSIPTDEGTHQRLRVVDEPTFIQIRGELYPLSVLANVTVQKRLFWGELPLQQISGFEDQHTGGIYTREFTTDILDVEVVEKEWKQIDKIEDLPTPPVLILVALDLYKEEPS